MRGLWRLAGVFLERSGIFQDGTIPAALSSGIRGRSESPSRFLPFLWHPMGCHLPSPSLCCLLPLGICWALPWRPRCWKAHNHLHVGTSGHRSPGGWTRAVVRRYWAGGALLNACWEQALLPMDCHRRCCPGTGVSEGPALPSPTHLTNIQMTPVMPIQRGAFRNYPLRFWPSW